MSQSFLYRWFGIGKVPRASRGELQAEGIILCEEGLSGRISYRKFKAPWMYSGRGTASLTGSVVLTAVRLVAFSYYRELVNVPLLHPRASEVQVEVLGPSTLQLTVPDASAFHDDRRGHFSMKLHTKHAVAIADAWQARSSA